MATIPFDMFQIYGLSSFVLVRITGMFFYPHFCAGISRNYKVGFVCFFHYCS